MKFHLILSLFFIKGFVCNSQVLPLKGEYSTLPYQISISRSYDSVWDSLTNFFHKEGYALHIKDKTEGLIISDRFNVNWSYERKGKLKDTSALIVVPMFYNKVNNTISPEPNFMGFQVANSMLL